MERISALMDGELDGDETARLIRSMNSQSELRESWSTYHLIGDALRGERCTGPRVIQAVSAQLAQEPTVLAPRRSFMERAQRIALPSLAAAAAVATVTWMSLGAQQIPGGPGIPTPVVEVILPVPSTAHQTSALADLVQPASLPAPPVQIQFPPRRIDAYLQAHHEFSPSKTMQGLASYARTVTASGVESGR